MRSGKLRDDIAKQTNAIAFDMEGAGMCKGFPSWVVIKGVCDYAGSHKNKKFQGYAAATAAAATKDFLVRNWVPLNRRPLPSFRQTNETDLCCLTDLPSISTDPHLNKQRIEEAKGGRTNSEDDCQRTAIEGLGNWLLIIDNADDVKLFFGDTALAEYLPFSRRGSILVTTRNHELGLQLVGSRSFIVPVEEMSREEALKLLGKNLKVHHMSNKRSTNALLEFLAYLPLAIRQASAYMAKKQISTTEYLELCKSSNEYMIELLSKEVEDRHRYKSIQNAVATTWLISFQQISDHDPVVAKVLERLEDVLPWPNTKTVMNG
ncbi:hypothetical protein QBC38DRAFT_550624 [Podospora fimiseda]|uniref:NB-ARC domain-containing protein n=1 Tax=Podospora fimiseda TaxID=252190 RepID=A0AAN6YPN7_9PEZI|nr:hypothetical protein QBC38DRAFT_550624 [Podospora fimiseda]